MAAQRNHASRAVDRVRGSSLTRPSVVSSHARVMTTFRSLGLPVLAFVAAAACTPSGTSTGTGAPASSGTSSTTTGASAATAATPAESISATPATASATPTTAPDEAGASAAAASTSTKTVPDIEYVPTPTNVVEKMFEAAKLSKDDVLY